MRIRDTIKADIAIDVEIICNNCGKSYDMTQVQFFSHPIHGFTASFGYGSKYDTDTWSFDLCEKCLERMVSQFMYRTVNVNSLQEVV